MNAHHYLVVSDLHLCDVEDHADGWKRHKSSGWVFDDDFDAMVASFEARVMPGETLTLILNGDIFDFDLVTAVPDPPPFRVRRIERSYGLDATAPKSAWKFGCILDDHPRFVATLARLIGAGHRVVVTIGNHDRELWFPTVQAVLSDRISAACDAAAPPSDGQPAPARGELVIEPWFFHVPGEIYVEHGHQYDFYSSFRYNLEPIVERHGEPQIALSTGNLSNRFLLSNIGYFNPHATDFILSAYGYIRHWVRHYAFTRHFLILTWLVGSVRALFVLLGTRARLERHPPTDYLRHVHAAATRYQLAPATAEALYALRKEPITARFHKIVREFWIDRLLIAVGMTGGTVALGLSGAPLWVKLVVPLIVFPLVWFIYAWVAGNENALTTEHRAQHFAHTIAGMIPVRAVVFGHTHAPAVVPLASDVTFANSGTWAPTWDDDLRPVAGLRNFTHVRVTPVGRATLPAGSARAVQADYVDGCQVIVGSWLPLSPAHVRVLGTAAASDGPPPRRGPHPGSPA